MNQRVISIPGRGEAILDLLESLSDHYEIAMLVVTHSREVTRICSRVVEMRDGALLEEATA